MTARAHDLHRLSRPDRADAAAAPPSPVTAPPPRWKTRVLLPVAALLVVATVLLLTAAESILPATPVRVVPVVVKTVEGAAGSVTVQAPGWLEPDPHPHYVTSLADGVVEEMLVLEGDAVEAGQVLARLVDDDARLALQRAEAELLRSRSAVLSAEADLTAARLGLEHLVERTRAIALAEAGVAEARAEIEEVHADIAVERARLLELEDEHDRKSRLVETQAVSEAVVTRLRLRVDAQRATVDAARAREDVLGAKLQRAEADARAATANRELLIEERRAVALARAELGAAEGSVALYEAMRDEAALRLDRMSVRAPVAGIVLQRLAAPGSKLMRDGAEQSAQVVHLYDPAHLQVRVDVPLADAAQVVRGQAAEVTVEVVPDRTFHGRVTRIVHQADIQKNTVEVKVAIEDPTADLKPEMLARARFLARSEAPDGTVRQRIFAPEDLLRRGDDGDRAAFVVTRLVGTRGRTERRLVTTGRTRIDGWIEIVDGLRVGDLLIANPPEDLEPNDRIRVVGEQTTGNGG